MITGVYIVKQQIRIASGLKLNLSQESIKVNGYSMECRITAEDVKNNFSLLLPGKLKFINIPSEVTV